MSTFLDRLEIGEPVTSGSLFMFPLFRDELVVGSPLTLDEALQLGLVHIDETSLSGSVPELVVENRSARSVFLLDGEQVLGLKQNRTFNLSMLLKPHSRTVVPVSCLESGRWARGFDNVQAAEHVHFSSGRANKLRSVSESIRKDGTCRSDQGTVWRDISRKLESRQRCSPTSAEADFYSNHRRQLDEMTRSLRARPDQAGAVVGFGNRLIGLDVFLAPKLYERLHRKLLKSFLLDAIDCEDKGAAPSRDSVARKIRALFADEPVRTPAPGEGEALRWETKSGSAAALFSEGQCIHAVAFCSGENSDEAEDLEVA